MNDQNTLSLYRLFRSRGLNAIRAKIAARLMGILGGAILIGREDCEPAFAACANSIRGWSDHMCRTFVSGGYSW